MNSSFDLLVFCQLGMGFFWTLTYILIIKCGFRDKTFGMPLAAICANISWEFIFSFIFPHQGIQRLIDVLWFVLDCFIIYQYIKFGSRDFKKFIPAKYFYPMVLLVLALSFSIIIAITLEFKDFIGKYSAFSQNLMMSVLFVMMLIRRGNRAGQSLGIAVFKMLGSLLPAISSYFYDYSLLILLLSLGTFIFDFIYMALLSKTPRIPSNKAWSILPGRKKNSILL